jgi:hypothetical protein
MEALLAPVQVVCERTHPGVWAEPLNALTSLAYAAVAAAFAWRWRHELHTRHPLAWLLALLLAIGTVSFAAHTFSIHLTHLLNGAFTAAFMALAFYLLARHALKLGTRLSLTVTVGLLTLSSALGSLAGMFEAQQQLAYLPALGLLLAAGYSSPAPAQSFLWAGAATFALALVFHAADLPTCALTGGYGTHWLWHLLNDTLMACLLLALHHLMKAPRHV